MFKREKIESKEKEPINFKEIFEMKMKEVKPSKNDELEFYNSEGGKVIKQIIKEIPGVYFLKGNSYELWVKDVAKGPHNGNNPHAEVRDSLYEFTTTEGGGSISVYILESGDGEKFLAVPNGFFVGRQINKIDDEKQKFLDLIKKYNIERIIGQFDNNHYKKEYINLLINNDWVGQIREDSQLKSFAEKYKMTNNQFIRFRMRANSMFDAQKKKREIEQQQTSGLEYSVVLDDLAKEIIKEQDEQ